MYIYIHTHAYTILSWKGGYLPIDFGSLDACSAPFSALDRMLATYFQLLHSRRRASHDPPNGCSSHTHLPAQQLAEPDCNQKIKFIQCFKNQPSAPRTLGIEQSYAFRAPSRQSRLCDTINDSSTPILRGVAPWHTIPGAPKLAGFHNILAQYDINVLHVSKVGTNTYRLPKALAWWKLLEISTEPKPWRYGSKVTKITPKLEWSTKLVSTCQNRSNWFPFRLVKTGEQIQMEPTILTICSTSLPPLTILTLVKTGRT